MVCGEVEQGTCEPPAGERLWEPCGEGFTGIRRRTWNYETCQWNPWTESNCSDDPSFSRCSSVKCDPGMFQTNDRNCCCEYFGAGKDQTKPIKCKLTDNPLDKENNNNNSGLIGGNKNNNGFTGPIGGSKIDQSK